MIYQLHLEQYFIIFFLGESITSQLEDKKIIKQKID